MFTGIVEEMGTVAHIVSGQDQANRLTITCRTVLEGTRIGDSIAVNGTCLTVTALTADSFTVGLSPETLRRTNLGRLHVGDPVNLERALAFGGRMGGHYVQGHVDGVGEIVTIVPEGDSKRVTIRPPASLLPYIVEKGYIAVDGVSLTVAEMGRETFTVALVAYTQSAIIMGRQPVGALVNIEVDIIAKYVERLLEAYRQEAR
ncbi:riboflavin synthase [Chloroflexus sp.]|uniref:riboflavin synthase n=1 Tax=Chloroflexus sp. TaxID=1904827 RepID=UPI002ADE085A|nr:riboflavin synthase [Chloroflexus sp.]